MEKVSACKNMPEINADSHAHTHIYIYNDFLKAMFPLKNGRLFRFPNSSQKPNPCRNWRLPTSAPVRSCLFCYRLQQASQSGGLRAFLFFFKVQSLLICCLAANRSRSSGVPGYKHCPNRWGFFRFYTPAQTKYIAKEPRHQV